MTTPPDLHFVQLAVDQALSAEAEGNLPVGAVLALDGAVIAAAGNRLLVPHYHPGRHAEVECLSRVEPELWARASEMTCYTTLEPCLMCFGTLLLHGVGRVVFGALDPEGGARFVFGSMPPFYDGRSTPEWVGPLASELCEPLYHRTRERFIHLPCVTGE